MPRRKGPHGISPAKRAGAAAHTKDELQTKKKAAADNNEDPGGGVVLQVPHPAPAANNDSLEPNNKYLHKKFKKMATTIDTAATVNGVCINKPANPESTREEASSLTPGVQQGRYVCPYCKLACAKPSVLQKHIRAHTNERPYPCHPCGFAFKTKSNLYKHCRSRAHALKVEEEGSGGAKFSVPSAESSEDIEDDEDENNSNNTPPPSALQPNCTVAYSSSVAFSSSSSSVPSVSDRPRQIYKPKFHKAALYQEEEEEKAAQQPPTLSLKIPTAPSSPQPFPSSSSIFANSKTPSSPSPEFLHRHINKIISENQAIVKTTDPQWSKKFQQRSREQLREDSPASPLSAASSPGIDGIAPWPSKRYFQRQMSLGAASQPDGIQELERNKQQSVQSKLALALMRPSSSPRSCDSPSSIPEPTSGYQQPLNLSTTNTQSKINSDNTDLSHYSHRKRSYSESFGKGQPPLANLMTVLKDHNILNANNNISASKYKLQTNSKTPLSGNTAALLDAVSKNHTGDKLPFHPQNPEGSIIKNLLLNARAASAGATPGTGYNTALADIMAISAETGSSPHYLLSSIVDEVGYRVPSPGTPYVCSHCNIPYRSAENLEIHQRHYCKGEGNPKPSSMASLSPMHSPGIPINYMSMPCQSVDMLSQSEDSNLSSKGSSISGISSISKSGVKFNKLDLKISKENSIKPTTLVMPPFPSPGPLLGSTPLVDSYPPRRKKEESESDEYEDQSTKRGGSLPKKRRLDPDVTSRDTSSTSPDIRSLSNTPISAIIVPTTATTTTTTLRSLEELSKCPMRPNSLQMFGGEVQILDGAGEMKTMRIEPSSRGTKSPGASGSTADLLLSLPNHLSPGNVLSSSTSNMTSSSENAADSACGNVSPHIVVTIARSGLHSGGTIVQVPQKPSVSANVPSGGVVKPPRSSGGTINCITVTATKSPSGQLQKNSNSGGGMILNSPSHSPLLSSNTNTVTNTFPDTTKLLVPIVPNIPTPNLSVPGIPAPNLSNLPFMPYPSIFPDGTLLNPLTQITAYNPLTLPPQPTVMQQPPPMKLTQPPPKEKKHSNALDNPLPPYSGGVVTILHGGKAIPYVPGMPGPQTLISSAPPPISNKRRSSPKPLDLASPSKENFVSLKVPDPAKTPTGMNSRPTTPLVAKSVKAQISSSVTTIVNPTLTTSSNHQDECSVRISSSNASAAFSASSSASKVLKSCPPTIPSIKVDCPVPAVDAVGDNEETCKKPLAVVRKISKVGVVPVSVVEGSERAQVADDDKPQKTDSEDSKTKSTKPKFLRPTSLPLKPGTFTPKKFHGTGLTPTGPVLSLVSPETPRPRKSYGQLYLNGHAYTYLGLKCSTRTFYCTLNRPQPMYVPQSPEHQKLSMYSNWKVCLEADPNPFGLDPGQAMALYDSRHRPTAYAIARPGEKHHMMTTHSSYWLSRGKEKDGDADKARGDTVVKKEEVKTEGQENSTSSENPPRRIKIFDGGFESNEDYIYIRGRGRGRYVCEECGIRCKKPSMLKKHIRTHTDVRPFTCKHCNFSFKTKGNLTKHMKSKAHYKKCVELGIVPVPTVVDDSYIDEECLAKQQALRASHPSEADSESEENEEEEEDEDEDDEDEEEEMLHIAEGRSGYNKGKLEREAACGLLSLSESTRVNASSTEHQYAAAGLIPLSTGSGRPNTYPYILSLPFPGPRGSNVSSNAPQTPTLAAVSAQTEREKVSRNTGLALELRGGEEDGQASSTIRRRGNAAALVLIPPQQGDANRYYFPSCRTPTIATSVPVPSLGRASPGWSDSDSEYSDDDHSFNSEDEKSDKDRDIMRKTSVGSYDKVDTPDGDSSSSQQPMDLSNKNIATTIARKLSSTAIPFFPSSVPLSGARTPTTPISEILTPVSEPATLLASLCSSVERIPATNSLLAQKCLTPDPAETTMLQAYLTERALQDVRMKQHQYHHHHNHHTYTTTSSTTSATPSVEPRTVLVVSSSVKEVPSKEMKIPQPVSEPTPPAVEHSNLSEPSELGKSGKQAPSAPEHSPDKMKIVENLPIKIQTSAEGMPPKMSLSSGSRNVVVGSLAFSGAPSSPPSSGSSSNMPKAEFMPPSSGPSPSYVSMTEDGRSICVICNKIFSKPSQLRLHVNIHYFERPFRCESCAVSFRTKGHLQKHERSVSHQNKVSMNSTFGTPTTTNPRPFKCDDCKIAFRIHGHLAKHLRSKMHIMKLECVGKLPFGTYAEMEREGISLNEIDTTDCENSLESLQILAQKLYEKDPSKLARWDGERGEVMPPHPLPHLSGGDTSSDEGEPLVGCHSPPHQEASPTPRMVETSDGGEQGSRGGYFLPSPEKTSSQDQNHGSSKESGKPSSYHSLMREELQSHFVNNKEIERRVQVDTEDSNKHRQFFCLLCRQIFTSLEALQSHSLAEHEEDTRHFRWLTSSVEVSKRSSVVGFDREIQDANTFSNQFLKRPKMDGPMDDEFKRSDSASDKSISQWNLGEQSSAAKADTKCQTTTKLCVDVSKSELDQQTDESAKTTKEMDFGVGPSQVECSQLNCDLCGKVQASQESLKKHLLSHVQPRPFVCEFCDAGFISAVQLRVHLDMHQQAESTT
ncbi:transcription factor HIVEP3 [Anabrus simplex]|uniref:transcription factor HIVEP3 n=1 Tax=Anabrus simplex TaxID=316456 RepID=UPI0035A38904